MSFFTKFFESKFELYFFFAVKWVVIMVISSVQSPDQKLKKISFLHLSLNLNLQRLDNQLQTRKSLTDRILSSLFSLFSFQEFSKILFVFLFFPPKCDINDKVMSKVL